MKYFNPLFLILCFSKIVLSQGVSVEIKDGGVLFKEKKDSILYYQTANKDQNGKYKRSNYIHPLYALDGHVLTEDFPADHPHHRGIFWAWHQLYIGDKQIGDGWLVKDFEWHVLSVEELKNKGGEKSIKANTIWKSPLWLDEKGKEKPLVSEYTTITVYPTEKNYRLIDFEIALIAQEPNTRIGGSEDEKGYGGFSLRLKSDENLIFTSSNGLTKPHLLPIKAGGWMDISAVFGNENSMTGIAILSHSKNPGYPNPWILRPKGSMQNSVYPYPGANAVSLSNVEPTLLRYRLVIHNGLKASEISSIHAQYGKM